MEFLFNIFKGTAIGIANVIPGVSGGTVAFILGIYDKLLESVSNFLKADKKQKKEYLIFLSSIGIGVLTGIIFFAKLIGILYKNYPEQTSYVFLGLVIGSIPYIVKNHTEKLNLKSAISLILGIVLVIIFLYFDKGNEKLDSGNVRTIIDFSYSIKLVICGALAAGAMVIPGISGSLLMLMIGEYHNIINFVNTRNYLAILLIGIGAGIGILLFSKIINFFLRKYRNMTIYFILGLILASGIKIYPGIKKEYLIFDIISFLVGFFIAYFAGNKKKG